MPHVPGSVSGPLFRNWWCSFTSPHYDRIYISHSVCLCVRGGFRIPSLLSMQAISVCLIYHRIATNFTSMGSMGNGGWSIHRTHVRQHLEPTSVATNWSRWNMIEFKFHQSPFSIWPHGFVQSDQNGSTPKFKRLCLSVFPNCKKKECHSGSFRIEHMLPILSIYTVLLSLTRPCICYDQIAVACPKARDSVGFAVDVSGGGVVCSSRDSRILHMSFPIGCIWDLGRAPIVCCHSRCHSLNSLLPGWVCRKLTRWVEGTSARARVSIFHHVVFTVCTALGWCPICMYVECCFPLA